MKTLTSSLLRFRRQSIGVTDLDDFVTKAVMDSNSDIVQHLEIRYLTRLNKYMAMLSIMVLQHAISLCYPLYDSILSNMALDFSTLCVILVLLNGIVSIAMVQDDSNDNLQSHSLMVHFIISHSVFIAISAVNFEHGSDFKMRMFKIQIITVSCVVLLNFISHVFELQVLPYKHIFYQQPQSFNSTRHVEMATVIILQWLLHTLNYPAMIEEIISLQIKNQEHIKAIQENEIHAASLVHELRNPLNSLMGTITLLEKSISHKTPQLGEIFSMSKSCGELLHTLIGNLLEYSKLKAKKIEINKSALDLKHIILRTLKLMYFKSQEQENKLIFFSSSNFPKKVIADEQRINQVLINLISNALKFTCKGSVSVYLGWRPGNFNVESENFQEAEREQPLQYIEQKYIFKHLETDEDEDQEGCYKQIKSSESIFPMDTNLTGNHSGPGYHFTHAYQQEDNLIKSSSFLDFDQVSARAFMRSTSDRDRQKPASQNNQNDYSQFFVNQKQKQMPKKNSKSDQNINKHFPNLSQVMQSDPSFQHPEDKKDNNQVNFLSTQNNNPYDDCSDANSNTFIDDYLLNNQELPDDMLQVTDDYAQPNQMYEVSMPKSQLNKSFEQSKSEVHYSTPKQDKILTEKQKKMIEQVAKKHKKATDSFVSEQILQPISSLNWIDEVLSTRREDDGVMDISFQDKLDMTTIGIKPKFMDTWASNQLKSNVYDSQQLHEFQVRHDTNIRHHQSSKSIPIYEEGKCSELLFKQRPNDDTLLENSMVRIRKQLANSKKLSSSSIANSQLNDQLSCSLTQNQVDASQMYQIQSQLMISETPRDNALMDMLGIKQQIQAPTQRTGVFGIQMNSNTPSHDKGKSMGLQKVQREIHTPHGQESAQNTFGGAVNLLLAKTVYQSMHNIEAQQCTFNNVGDRQQQLIKIQQQKEQSMSDNTQISQKQQPSIFETPFLGPDKTIKKDQVPQNSLLLVGHQDHTKRVETQHAEDKQDTLQMPQATQQKRSKTQKKIKIMIVGLDSHDDMSKIAKSPEKIKTPSVMNLNKLQEQETVNIKKIQSTAAQDNNSQVNEQYQPQKQQDQKDFTFLAEQAKQEISIISDTGDVIQKKKSKATKFNISRLVDEEEKKGDTQNVDKRKFSNETPKIKIRSPSQNFNENILSSSAFEQQKSNNLAETTQPNVVIKLNIVKNSDLLFQQSQQHDETLIERSQTMNLNFQNQNYSNGANLSMMRFSTMIFPAISSSTQQFDSNMNANINLSSEKGMVEIKVKDSGIGISQEGLKRLFKPYQQADKTIQKNYGGTGLGLCICYELIQCMNGKITVISKENHGTEFIVHIPMEISAEVTTLIDEQELDLEIKDIDLMNFEFVICKNEKSFGIQQIRKIFMKKQCNVYFKDAKELLQIDNTIEMEIFKLDRTYKAFILDYTSIKQNQSNLLFILANQNDQLRIDPSVLQGNTPQNINGNNNNFDEVCQLICIKVPVIVLISALIDESKIKKSDNIFVLRVPLEVKSVKKILIFLKRYYLNCIHQFKNKNQQGIESNLASKEEIPLIQDNNSNNTDLKISERTQSQYQQSNSQPVEELKIQPSQSKENVLLNPGQLLLRSSSNRSQRNLYEMQNQQLKNQNQFPARRKGTTLNNDYDLDHIKNARHFNSQQLAQLDQQNNQSNPIQFTGDLSPNNFVRGQSSHRSTHSRRENPKATPQFMKPPPLQLTKMNESSQMVLEQYALVVNDEQMQLKILSMLLQYSQNECGKNFSILIATDGKEAVEMYKTRPNIKLIMMDIQMRVMDGYEATRKIREYEAETKCQSDLCNVAYIIGVSGNQDQQHFRQCRQAGMNDAIVTPITQEKIKELINQLF